MSLRKQNRRVRQLARFAVLVLPPLALIGCGSVPPVISQPENPAVRPAPQAKASGLPVLPPAGSGRGGYYMDDGPGDAPPEGLMDTPDAEPRVEAYSKRANRPYVVFGKQYVPITDERPFKQRGIGSWYGKKFHGQKTSSGELYDMYKMTAAHPTLPIPSFARVTNVVNGKQVIVRVNDRGPFHSGRIIDLSYTAALKLGYLAKGSGELEVERLLPDEIERLARNRKSEPGRAEPSPEVAERSPSAGSSPSLARTDAAPAVSLGAVNLGGTELVQTVALEPAIAAQPAVVPAPPATSAQGYYLQLGAFSAAVNAEKARQRLAENTAVTLPPTEVVEYGTLYRLYSGPFATRAEAAAAAQQLEGGGTVKPMIVQR
ncbi:MAG TPA: septal ring lytic transglycosylase RlpA family protein [Noviherbaspirillum sp.]